MAKLLSVVVALAGLGGAALLWSRTGPSAPLVDAHAIAAELDGRLRETTAGVHSRASTLADLPRLAAAVSTDAATVRDLTQDELAFRPRQGEIITIGQVPKRGAPSVLLSVPDGSPPIAIDKAGLKLMVVAKKLMLTEVATVVPRERADEMMGAVAVSWPVDLQQLALKLDGLNVGAELKVAGASFAIGSHATAAGAETVSVPLEAEAGAGATLVVPVVHAADPTATRLAAGGVALAGLIAAALLGLRGRKPPQLAAAATGTTGASAATGVTGSTGSTGATGATGSTGATGAAVVAPGPDVGTGKTELAGTTGSSARPSGIAQAAGGQQRIGRFTVVRRLGAGGMAEVYLARASGEAGFEKLVALKVMHSSLASQPEIVEHFLDEAKLASRLTHPNIVQITDLGRAGDDYFIAMEYIDGADLEGLLTSARARNVQVPVKVALAIIRKICDGLHAAHTATDPDGKSLEIVHRDVKSANVFVARNGAVKVGDFGIAKANQLSRVKKTDVGMVKGTREYMAPEHRLGEAVDRRADLYAVGAIAYELLSGTAINLDLAMLAQRGREGWPHLPKLAQVRPELPPELDDVITKALAYERESRYSDCAALEEAIDAVASKHGLSGGEKQIAPWVEAELAAQKTTADVARSKTNASSSS